MMITEEELKRRKKHIIHTSFHLFCKNGIDGVTVADIAKAAELSEASIYRYFNTKAKLLSIVQSKLWREIAEVLFSSIWRMENYEEKNGLTQVSILLHGFYFLYHDNADYIMFSYEYRLYLIKHGLKLSEDEYEDILGDIRMAFIAAIKKGKIDGSILAEQKDEDLYFAIWGIMRGFVAKIAMYDRMYAGTNPWTKEFELVCSMVLNALKNGISKISYPI